MKTLENRLFNPRKRFPLTLGISLSLMVVLIGCGAQEKAPTQPKTVKTGNFNTETDPTLSPSPFDPGGGGGTGTGDTGSGLADPYVFRVSQIGYREVTFTVPANKILKLKFAPGEADKKLDSIPEMPVYARLGVYISVDSSEARPTPLLSNGYLAAAEQTVVMDFSSSFQHTCQAADTACRQTVTVKISRPNYDHFCLFPEVYQNWCATHNIDHTQVYDSHYWNGRVTVQTDDTKGI